MKNKHIYIPLFVFCGAAIVSLVASIIDFKGVNPEPAYSSQIIQFAYDGASDGKDPNGNAFNASDFLSDDIIQNGLTSSELDLEVEKVRAYITIENVVPKNIVNEINAYTSLTNISGDKVNITSNDYHPVRYRISLDSDLGLSKAKTSDLLANIVDNYCLTFYQTYKKTYDKSFYDAVYNVADFDYIYQAQVLKNKITNLKNYASDVHNIKDDNAEFDAIIKKCDSLINTDVSRITNLIKLSSVSRDLQRLKDYYNYKIQNATYLKAKYQKDLASVIEQLNGYTKDSTIYVSNGDTIITIESNSSATYDKLSAAQIELSNEIAKINAQIKEYQDILADIESATGEEEAYVLVRKYIQDLEKDFGETEDQFIELLDIYNETYIKDGVSKSNVSYKSSSLFSGAFIRRAIKISAPIMLITMLGIAIFYLVWVVKKEKGSKQH